VVINTICPDEKTNKRANVVHGPPSPTLSGGKAITKITTRK